MGKNYLVVKFRDFEKAEDTLISDGNSLSIWSLGITMLFRITMRLRFAKKVTKEYWSAQHV